MDELDHASPSSNPPPVSISDEVLSKMGVAILKEELKKRGLAIYGKKSELMERLKENLHLPVAEGGTEIRDTSMNGLPFSAWWELLEPNAIPIAEPCNADAALRPPTEREGAVSSKFGYDLVFDRVPFTGTDAQLPTRPSKLSPRKTKFQRKKSLSREDQDRTKPVAQPRTLGGPNIVHLKRYGLGPFSHPMDWFTSLMPLTPEMNKEEISEIDAIGDGKTKFCVSNWRSYLNSKAEMAGAGYEGHEYQGKWKPFTDEDVQHMLGAITLDGLAPSPQMESKFKSQSVDPTQGNDRVANCIGPNAGLKWRLFRKFFGVQDPHTTAPKRADCPNYKCHSIFDWARWIWKKGWCPSKWFAADEQTCPMQGQSIYKSRCGKFKRVGDGLQADCLADDGYTFDFYFRNEPVDEKWVQMGLAPLHCRLMHMFSRLDDQGHECNMDNLYNSVNFARAAYNLEVSDKDGNSVKKYVKTQGVVRASGRGVPPCVRQEMPKGKAAQMAAKGTTKLAVLRGDPNSSDLLVGSCYDQRPFYMLSHAASSVGWVEKSKKVYSHELKKEVEFKFLRWSLSDNYNYEMNDNDIADQYRLVYRCLRFQRNTKWWWAEFLYIWETTISNSYHMMRRFFFFMGLKVPYTHYQFQEKIAWALLDPINCWPTKNKVNISPLHANTQSQAPAPLSMSTKGSKRKRFTANSLSLGGAFENRLDCTLGHFPTPLPEGKKKTTVCQLHRMANRVVNGSNDNPPGARTDVYICRGCDAALCVSCWSTFHQKTCFKNRDYEDILDN